MNILFYTTISPFPQNGGEKIRSCYLLKALASLGHSVHAIIGNKEKTDLEEYAIPGVTFHTHNQPPLTLAERLTGKFYFRQDPSLIRLFAEICGTVDIDVAILDYGFVGQYIPWFNAGRIPVILGTHNSQALHTLQKPANGIVQKLRRSQLVNLEKTHEQRYFPQAAAVMTVSDPDKQYHAAFIDPKKIFVVPNFLDETDYNIKEERNPRLLAMTANFSMYMNFEGLKWLVEQVWNDELADKFELWLVGRHSIEALQQLKGSAEWKNIKAIGKVADIKPYIAQSAGVLIPLLHGSGTRLKCLEAMALGTPVIGTSKGVEGVVSDNFIVANTPESFRKAVSSFSGKGQLGGLLREDFMKEYSAGVNRDRLDHILQFAARKAPVVTHQMAAE
ncbi:glycosyltransferase [Chitinophaga barathri]|uniref:Glycosyltransferase n=1 Tax=Chitinophaga barathri TaxID=1647451 RepID=A0A3N4MCY1_9BACT|nr:glycosyltransferase [Chitinophaga barathri]RPD41792.1 glycosyltransferase [Chitinophaga barathri]